MQEVALLQPPRIVGVVRRAQQHRGTITAGIADEIFAVHQHPVAGDRFDLRNIGKGVHEDLGAGRLAVGLEVRGHDLAVAISLRFGCGVVDDANGDVVARALVQCRGDDRRGVAVQPEIVDGDVEARAGPGYEICDEFGYSGDLRRAFRRRRKGIVPVLLEKCDGNIAAGSRYRCHVHCNCRFLRE